VARSTALALLVLLAALAVADGVYLTLVHLDYETGRESASSACHAFSASGCSVTAGRFGALFGVPVATIGSAGALTTAVLGAIAWRRRDRPRDSMRALILGLALASVAVSLLMATFSVLEGSFCPFCVAWYGLNLALAGAAWMARDRGLGIAATIDEAFGPQAMIAVVVFGTALGCATAVHHRIRGARFEERQRELLARAPEIGAELAATMRSTPRRDLDLEGLPAQGSPSPTVHIVEFSDFQCPFCRKLWDSLETYLEDSPHAVRVYFVNYPLDQSCNPGAGDMHPQACEAARASICAHAQGKFWAYGSELFEHQSALGRADLVDHAKAVGLDTAAFEACLEDPKTHERLARDIALGERLELRATPTIYINGYELQGAYPLPILAATIDALVAADANP